MMLAGVLGALIIVTVDIWVRAVRLRVLLGGSLTTREAVAVNQLGEAASAVTPARIGGEPVRFAELKRLQHPTASIVAVLIVERVIGWGLMAAIVMAAVALGGVELVTLIGDRVASLRSPLWMMVGLLLVLAIGLSWWWAIRYRRKVTSVTQLAERSTHLPAQPISRLAGATGLTALSMALRTAVLPVIAWPMVADSVGIATLGSFVLLYSQTVLPTPSGVGVVEVGFVAGMGSLGDAATIASVLITWRVLTVGVGAAIGAWILIRRGASWSRKLIKPSHRGAEIG